MAASPVSIQRQSQQQQQHSNGPIDIDHQGQGQYRMSFSPNGEREQQTYSGIVGNAARSIFGSSDDETYLVSLIIARGRKGRNFD